MNEVTGRITLVLSIVLNAITWEKINIILTIIISILTIIWLVIKMYMYFKYDRKMQVEKYLKYKKSKQKNKEI